MGSLRLDDPTAEVEFTIVPSGPTMAPVQVEQTAAAVRAAKATAAAATRAVAATKAYFATPKVVAATATAKAEVAAVVAMVTATGSAAVAARAVAMGWAPCDTTRVTVEITTAHMLPFKLPQKEAFALAQYFGIHQFRGQTLLNLRTVLHDRWMGAQPFKAAITVTVIAPPSRGMH